MIHRAALAVLSVSLFAAAPANRVNEVIDVVRTGLRNRQSDGAIAKSLHKMKLAERLEGRVIEELESEGAGPKALAELALLGDSSGRLPPPAAPLPFDTPPAPATPELRRVLSEASAIAVNYAKSLPDFICIQTVRRSDNLTGRWRLNDTLELKLSYFGQKEDYKLLSVNGRPTGQSYDSIGGAITQGEFGSLLRQVFEPKSLAEFRWDHWTRLRKRQAYVVAFVIRAENSSFRLEFQRGRGTHRYSIVPGQRGFVWIDRETNNVLRIQAEADDVPPEFPVRSSSTLLDYEFTAVGDRQFLLPLRADVRLGSKEFLTKNQVEFQAYRKFSSEATISFDAK